MVLIFEAIFWLETFEGSFGPLCLTLYFQITFNERIFSYNLKKLARKEDQD